MSTYVLRRRVDHDVGAPLNGTTQRGRRARIVDNQRYRRRVRDLRQLFDVGNIEFGIAQSLGVQRLGFRPNGLAKSVEVVGVDKLHRNTQLWQRVVKEVVR